jgi:hypothetical protein
MGDNGRFRALATAYVGLVLLCAGVGIFAARPGLTTLALVLTLPAGFAYGPIGFVVGFARLGAGDLVPHMVNLALIGALAVANVSVVRWLRRILPADPAAAAVRDRLARTLVGSGVIVTPMARTSERVRTHAGEVRLEHSLDLRDLPMPYRDLLGMFRAMWQRAGLLVQERPDPPAVRAVDAQGYEFLVEPGPYGEAVLQVASPPQRERGFVAGALLSGLPTGALFAFGVARYVAAGGAGTDPLLHALYPLIAGCLVVGPGALLIGFGCLFRYHAQAFGRGLLLGGSPCLAVALLYAVPLVLQGR